VTNEYVTEDNTSKYTRLSRESYAVGALARINNNFKFLVPEAKAVAAEFSLAPVCHNPFMMNVAQLVEAVHCTYESIRLIDEILSWPAGVVTMAEVVPQAGIGVGAVEVPRGILFHEYEYDDKGRIVRANCVIPTTQNHKNIKDDLQALVAKYSVYQDMTGL